MRTGLLFACAAAATSVMIGSIASAQAPAPPPAAAGASSPSRRRRLSYASTRRLRRCLHDRRARLPGLEVRDHLLAKKANSVEHLLVLRRPDCAQQNCFLDAQGFVQLEKPDAVGRRADAELRALLAHLLGCGLARMRPAGEALIARVIALIIRRHGRWIIVAPHH